MVRSSQATTFSSSPFFFDRGAHGTAQPITERINVRYQYLFKTKKVHLKDYVLQPHSRPIVSYYFPKGVGGQHYGVCLFYFIFGILGDRSNASYKERHPMKPHRLTLTNALVMGYGLDKQIHHIYDPRPATKEELESYHDSDYIEFLSRFVTSLSKLCSTISLPISYLELPHKTRVP